MPGAEEGSKITRILRIQPHLYQMLNYVASRANLSLMHISTILVFKESLLGRPTTRGIST